MTPDLALAVEGLRIHEHEESFPSEGEDEEEDISASVSDDSSLEDDANDDVAESSDEETILAPRTMASLSHPISDEALRARLSPFSTFILNIAFPLSLNPKRRLLYWSMSLDERRHKDPWEWSLFH